MRPEIVPLMDYAAAGAALTSTSARTPARMRLMRVWVCMITYRLMPLMRSSLAE